MPSTAERVLTYLDEHEKEGVQLLRDLVRIKSLAHQESDLVAFLRGQLGRAGRTEIAEQSLGPSSQNLIEVLPGPTERCMAIRQLLAIAARRCRCSTSRVERCTPRRHTSASAPSSR